MRDRQVLLALTFSLIGTPLLPSLAQSPGLANIGRPVPAFMPAANFAAQAGSSHSHMNLAPVALHSPVSHSGLRTTRQPMLVKPETTASGKGAISSSLTHNLDLSSTVTNLTAGNLGGRTDVKIDVGGKEITVRSTTLLTPAEKLAVYQVERTGKQLLIIDSQGSAVGGTVVLTKLLSNDLGNLVIPDGVTVIDISKSGILALSGNLTDDGNLDLSTQGHAGAGVSVEASNISVQSQGTIADILPKSSARPNDNVSLNLTAQNDLVNGGTITSTGALDVTAGATVTNSSTGTMQSQGNTSLTTGSGTFINNGLIQSTNGNINMSAKAAGSDIDVNASAGTFQALKGAINLRDSSYNGTGNANLAGGNYLSSALNIYSGQGSANTNVNSISGVLGINAGQAHTLVSAGNLQVGNTSITGDPTYYNANGNLTVTGNISVGEALSLAASGNILSKGNYSITANNGASGFDINVIAGANITPGAGGAITISGPSSTGGNVTFSGHKMAISSAAVSGNSSGGDVNIVAFANAAGTSGGQVALSPKTTINTGGSGTGANGNVQILAGAGSGTAITTGGINTSGGAGGGGNISIQTSQPAIHPNPLTIAADGTVAGIFSPGNATNAASVVVNAPINSGGNVTIESANTVTVKNAITAGTAGDNITIESPGNLKLAGRGNLTTTASGTTSLQADAASGSSLTIAGGTALKIGGGGQVDILTPNLLFAGPSSLKATGASEIFVNAGRSQANVDLNIKGTNTDTISTNAGVIDVSSTGNGDVNFLKAGKYGTTLNLNAAGAGGPGVVDVRSLGNITIAKNVTVSSNSPIMFNIGNTNTDETFTLNGVIKTTAANAPFPDPLGGSMFFSVLIQNLIFDYNFAGTGTILQAGKTPGDTVFNDFTGVNFLNGTKLKIKSHYKGSYTDFYTSEIGLEGSGISKASLQLQNIKAVNFETDLPAGFPDEESAPQVSFKTGSSVTSGTLRIIGAPVNVGFAGQAPPSFLPALQQPLNDITIGQGFNLIATKPISLYADNSNFPIGQNSVNVLGTVTSLGANHKLTVLSPSGQVLNLLAPGSLIGSLITLTSTATGDSVNFEDNFNLEGRSQISAPNGSVTIESGKTVRHKGLVTIFSQGAIPAGFAPTTGVKQSTSAVKIPKNAGVTIVSPELLITGSVSAQGSH